MFVRKKTYLDIVDENKQLKEKLQKTEMQLLELAEKNDSIEQLTEKEQQIIKSIKDKELINQKLSEEINERKTVLNSTEEKLGKSQITYMHQILSVKSCQVELKRINQIVEKQSRKINERILKELKKLANQISKEIKKKKSHLLYLDKQIKLSNQLFDEKEPMLRELKKLKKQIVFMREERKLQEVGFYKGIFKFKTTEEYKDALATNNKRQKEMIRNKIAVLEGNTWTVNGSKRAGRTMTNNNIKMMLRVFNCECDKEIQSLKYSNLESVEKKIRKSFDAINKFNETNVLKITEEYLRLKLEEIELVYERLIFQQEEKEKIKQYREEERERKRVEKEIREKYKELESREKDLQKQLIVAEKNYANDANPQEDLLHEIQDIKTNIELVHKKRKEVDQRKAIGKSGYVYIISNIGAFGEGVYKIGMTRRLDPSERITELSGAAVPFRYDVHAMILSDDAPRLENHLHQVFNENRVNLMNNRKEFFLVDLEEVKREVFALVGKSVIFNDLPTAADYYATQDFRQALLTKDELQLVI